MVESGFACYDDATYQDGRLAFVVTFEPSLREKSSRIVLSGMQVNIHMSRVDLGEKEGPMLSPMEY